jgi:iron complex transport system ATP-binding protein
MDTSAALFELENVTIYRGTRRVLDRLSLSIAAGQHVAILGQNGSGKSTLIKALTRECYPVPDEGPFALRVLGRDRWDVTSLRAMLGIVTNDLVADCVRGMSSDFAEGHHRVTGRDTVLSGFFSSIGIWAHHEVTRAMRDKADAILQQLDIAHVADRPLHELSSGEARRLVIGRALVHDPAALVLDEVTNSLDLKAAHQLRESLRNIARAGTSVILVTHHLDEVIPEVDRVVLLKDGRLFGDGAKADMLTSARLSELFGATVDVWTRDGYFHAW